MATVRIRRGQSTEEIMRALTPVVMELRSEAWTLGHGEAVVAVDGMAGGHGLAFVRPAPGASR